VPHPRVLCLGEVLYDCLADQVGKPYVEVESWTPYPGGAPANVACAVARLGIPAGFIGCVGQDKPGTDLVELLQVRGVDISGVQRHETAPTRQVYVVRSETGDRSFAGFGKRDTTEFSDAYLKADGLVPDLFKKADFLILGTLELAYPETKAAVQQALTLAEEHEVKIIVDVNWRPMFWPNSDTAMEPIMKVVQQADFVKLTDEEADLLFQTQDPAAIAEKLSPLKGVLVTAGEKGCSYAIGEHTGTLPAFEIEVEDTTGAGDSFTAGFIYQLCQQGPDCLQDGEKVKEVMRYASAVGAMTTMRPGAIAAQPKATEVAAFLYLHPQQ